MDNEQDEAVLRITAQYVKEFQAGHRPQLGAYIARYPQHADELADFVAYYHAVESTLPDTDSPSNHAEDLPIAIEYLLEMADQNLQRHERPITTLLVTKNNEALSIAKLAQALHVSSDIAARLERRTIVSASIPSVVFNRLAHTLQQPEGVIRAYFVADSSRSVSTNKVAEGKMPYVLEEHIDEPLQSFRQVLKESSQLSNEQKHEWYVVLKREGL